MAETPHPRPTTVEVIFNDFKGCRAGIVKALTVDFKEFYEQCDPEKDSLCLHGFPNETWGLKLPEVELPPDQPEPIAGINFARDGMPEKDWQTFVAVHSYSWLLAVAFFYGEKSGFDKSDRERFFKMINDYPTVYEEVVSRAVEDVKKQAATHNNGRKSKSQQPMINEYPTLLELFPPNAAQSRQPEPVPNVVAMSAPKEEEDKQGSSFDKSDRMRLFPMINDYPTPFMPNAAKSRQPEPVPNVIEMPYPKDEDKSEEEEDEQATTELCRVCGEEDVQEGDEEEDFWICCDVCNGWFHGKCVKITPAEAKHIKQYKCPTCSKKKFRPQHAKKSNRK